MSLITPPNSFLKNENVSPIDINHLKTKRIIYAILFILSLFLPILTFYFSKFLIILFIYFIVLFSILFIKNENELAMKNFIITWNQVRFAPWIIYGILLFTLSICAIANTETYIYAGTFFILSLGCLKDGVKTSTMISSKNWDTVQYVFQKNNWKIGKMLLMFPILVVWVFIIWVFLLMSSGGISLGHGRFLFFWFNRKPRKAVIKDSNSWLIKN